MFGGFFWGGLTGAVGVVAGSVGLGCFLVVWMGGWTYQRQTIVILILMLDMMLDIDMWKDCRRILDGDVGVMGRKESNRVERVFVHFTWM